VNKKGIKSMEDYKLLTYGGYLGEWYCRITYPTALGNSYEAQVIMHRSLDAAKRSIRRAIVERNPQPVRRLRYSVLSNNIDAMNRLHGLVITEA
jgi:hypothetical protein